MFKIGEFSKLTMISIKMLRHYDEIGLLAPETVDSFTGYRYYSARQLEAAGKIQALKSMGFGLATIREILAQYGDAESFRRYLAVRLSQMREESRDLGARLAILENTIERLGKDDNSMKYDVTLKEIPAMQVMSLRGTMPSYDREGDLWQKLYAETAGQHVQAASPAYAIAVFFDEGFKESDVDVEIRTAVAGSYQDTEHVRFKEVPAVKVASCVIRGSYASVSDACAAIGEWIDAGGWRISGPMFNIYHVSPAMDPNPENWVTEICFPVEK